MQTTQRDESRESASAESSPDNPELSRDDLFHVLQNERRRLALRYLLGRDGTVDVATLVDQVAAREFGVPVEELPAERRQRVHLDLYQSHLPKLEEYGLVSYDQSRDEVEPTVRTGVLEPYLDLPSTDDADEAENRETDDWLDYYVIATIGSVLLLGLAWVGPLSATLSFGAAATGIVAVYAALTAGLVLARDS